VSRESGKRVRRDPRAGAGRGRGRSEPEKVRDFLADVLEREGVAQDVARQSALEEWPSKVGEKIAGVTRARSVADATMVVEVRSSPWLMELNMMKGEILERLNQGRDVPLEKLVFVMSPEG
jgi:predicted nucleic acid-binding Zn ribbon protein